jgi:hypothetical protein
LDVKGGSEGGVKVDEGDLYGMSSYPLEAVSC